MSCKEVVHRLDEFQTSSIGPILHPTFNMPLVEHSLDRRSPKNLSPARRSRSFDESPRVRRSEVTSNSRSLSPKPKTARTHNRRSTAHKSSEPYIEASIAADRVLTQVFKEPLSNESVHQFLIYDEPRMGNPRRPERRGSVSQLDSRPARDWSVERPRPPVRQASIVEPSTQRRRSLSATAEYTQCPVKRSVPRTQSAIYSPSTFRGMESPTGVEQSHVKRSAPPKRSIIYSPNTFRGTETKAVPNPVKQSASRTKSAIYSPTGVRSMESPSAAVTTPVDSSAWRSPVRRSVPRTRSAMYSPGELSSPDFLSTRPAERRRSLGQLVQPTPKNHDVDRTNTAVAISPTKPTRKPVVAVVDGTPIEQSLEDANPKPTKDCGKSFLRRQTLLKRGTPSHAGKSATRSTAEARDTRQQQRMMKLYRKASQEPSPTIKIRTVPSIVPKRFSLAAINVSDAALFYSPRKDRQQETKSSPLQAPIMGPPPQRRRHSLDFSPKLQSPNVTDSPRRLVLIQ
jgi:hypothetical protein